MKLLTHPLILGLLIAATPVRSEELRELGQGEIRSAVEQGASQDLGSLLSGLSGTVEGKVIDVRAFLGDTIYYQFSIMLPDGSVIIVVLDGRTGRPLPNNSEQAKVVRAAAGTSGGMGNGKSGENGNAGGNGNGNAGGNGNGNSGGNGNGNGNSGGNGNGKK